MRLSQLSATLLVAVALSGCSVGIGGYLGNNETGELAQNIGTDTASYQVVDLDSGVITQRETIPDLTSDPAYRTSRLVFRRVAGGSESTGAAVSEIGAQGDETKADVQVTHFYIAVFEITQAQWVRLTTRAGATSSPWSTVTPVNVVSGVGDSYPAWGLSRQVVERALAAQPGTARMALPSETQWEVAARGDTTTAFWWGDDPDEATVTTRARVVETNGGGSGPTLVGSLTPNPLGLYDIAGNVWELTASGALRGGSWHDTVYQARSANRLTIDTSTAHALVGVRPILVP